MQTLKELVIIAEREQKILISMERELEKCEDTQDTIKYLKIEKKVDKQYEKFFYYLEEITKCLSCTRDLYSWYGKRY